MYLTSWNSILILIQCKFELLLANIAQKSLGKLMQRTHVNEAGVKNVQWVKSHLTIKRYGFQLTLQ
jgi:hypothetical protein